MWQMNGLTIDGFKKYKKTISGKFQKRSMNAL